MADVYCAKCGEPWDSYGITYALGEGDLTVEEVRRFRRGEGCPNCEFGMLCPRCHGGKIEQNGCHTCFGSGYVFAWRCRTAANPMHREWCFGYLPNVRLTGSEPFATLTGHLSAEGWVEEGKCACPECHGQGEPCKQCEGTGEFRPLTDHDPGQVERALQSLLDASDEDPLDLIEGFEF